MAPEAVWCEGSSSSEDDFHGSSGPEGDLVFCVTWVDEFEGAAHSGLPSKMTVLGSWAGRVAVLYGACEKSASVVEVVASRLLNPL